MTEPAKPFTMVDLPEDAFPFTIEFYKDDTSKEVIQTFEVEGPGALEIPGLKEVHGPIGVRVKYPDGSVDISDTETE